MQRHSTRPAATLRGWLALIPLLALPALAQGARSFPEPQAALDALLAAAQANDDAALQALVGDASAELVLSGQDPAVAANRAAFCEKARAGVAFESQGENQVIIVVGEDRWPLPVPLVKGDDGWHFDAEAGREEILARRIGANELEAIALCQAYVDAQVAYASEDRDGDRVREYAQNLRSTAGTHDGLYWESEEDDSPLGAVVAPLAAYLTEGDKVVPWNGYYWKILTAQGEKAPGGAHSYIINGNMIAGFALVAVPAQYRNTGVMTFLVSHHGEILECDLGETSLDLVKAMSAFDPGDDWTVVEPED